MWGNPYIDKYVHLIKKWFFVSAFLFFLLSTAVTNVNLKSEQQYVYLAQSFLQGKVYFTELPGTWEDVVVYKGKYYWHQGPFPAVLLMPFVFVSQFFHIFFYQGYLQFFITLGIMYFCYWLARYYKYSQKDSLLLAFGFCFASVYIIVAFIPWVWYFVQAVTVLLLFLALYEYHTKKRYLIIGVFYAAIFASRFTAGLTCIFFLLTILKENTSIRIKCKNLIFLLSPIAIVGMLLLIYNYLRFENIFDNGFLTSNYAFLTKAQLYEVVHFGLFKVSNIPTNIYYYFIKTLDPVLIPVQSYWGNTYMLQAPYVTVRYPGTSFFVASPLFLYIFKNKCKTYISKISWVAIIAVLIPLMLYYWPGWRQMGPRYMLDLLPFGYLLLLESFPKRTLSTKAKLLIWFSALFNLYLLQQVMPH